MIVMKFGGTSVGNGDAFAQVAQITQERVASQATAENPGVVIITSAMSGVTNTLIDAARQAEAGNEEPYQRAQESLRVKHQQVIGRFIEDGQERAALGHLIDERLREFGRLCQSIAVLGELTQRGLDVVSGLGERMSAPLLAAVLRAHGIKAEFVDAGEIVITDNVHGGAEPIMDVTAQHCQERLLPLIQEGVVPVITGYVGTSSSGIPTTLGRGGSDYSAAIVGAVLNADEIQILTDVNGVMTADPRVVPDARSLRELTYEEMGELAFYGAKVLHPKTAIPALEKQIPLRVLNTFEPQHPGTLIVKSSRPTARGNVKAVTSIRNMSLITVAGRGMMGIPGIAARTFQSVANVDANVLMISQGSSEQSICFVVPDAEAPLVMAALQKEFAQELDRRYVDQITNQSDIVVIAVVGSGMRGVPGLAARLFSALGQKAINVIAIAQGSSEANISLVVDDETAADAVRAIHASFQLHKPTEERI